MKLKEKKNFWNASVFLIVLCLCLGCGGGSFQTKSLPKDEPLVSNKKSLQKMLTEKGFFCPVDAGNYQIGPEDLLEINIYGQNQLNRIARVNRDGMIKLPLIGDVKVGGHNAVEIEKVLEKMYGENYLRNPQVTVFVKEYRHQRVSVVGAVNKPGTYALIGPRTIFDVLAEAGGLKDEASDVIHVIRNASKGSPPGSSEGQSLPSGSPQTLVINLRNEITKGGSTNLCNLPIQHGDMINVPYAGYAYVTGEVQKPGKVPVKQGLTVTQAVAMAGSLTPVASSQAQILRFDDQGQRQVIPVDLHALNKGAGEDVFLKEEDVVVVQQSAGKRLWQGLASIFHGAFYMGYGIAP